MDCSPTCAIQALPIAEQLPAILTLLSQPESTLLANWNSFVEFVDFYKPKEKFYEYKTTYAEEFTNEKVVQRLIKNSKETPPSDPRLSIYVILLRILARIPSNVETMIKSHGNELAYSILSKSQNTVVLAETCAYIQNLALDEDNKAALREIGVIDMIVNSVKQHFESVKVVTNAWGSLMNLAICDDNKVHIVTLGCIPLVTRSLDAFAAHTDLITNACGILQNLALNDDYKIKIAEHDGIKLILRAMNWHSSKANSNLPAKVGSPPLSSADLEAALQERKTSAASICVAACSVLQNLALDDNNQQKISEEHGIQLILQAMRAHPTGEHVQEHGCAALWNLSLNKDHMEEIIESEGIKCIIDAITNHIRCVGVLKNACGALWNLSVSEANQKIITKHNGVDVLLSVMRENDDSAEVQFNACGVIMNMARDEPTKVMIAAKGGIDLIVHSMMVHPQNVEVARYACAALWNLAVNDDNKDLIAAKKGIDAILGAMRAHQKDHELINNACGALWNICVREHNTMEIAQKGGMELIIAALKNFPGCHDVQRHACGALRNLAVDDNNARAIPNLDGIDILVDTMKRNIDSPQVLSEALAALWNVAIHDENKAAIVSACQVIADIMKSHPSLLEVQHVAVGSLFHISKLDKNNTVLAQCGILPLCAACILEFGKEDADSDNEIIVFAADVIHHIVTVKDASKGGFIVDFLKGGTAQLLSKVSPTLQKTTGIPTIFSHLRKQPFVDVASKSIETVDGEAKKNIALDLPYLVIDPEQRRGVFIKHKWLQVLLDLLKDEKMRERACDALSRVFKNTMLKTYLMPKISPKNIEEEPRDVIFSIRGQGGESVEIEASKDLLSERSEYFSKLFGSCMRESSEGIVYLEQVDSRIFKRALEFLYTYTFEEKIADVDECYELMVCADRFQLEDLKLFCELYFADRLDLHTVVSFYDLAICFNAPKLRLLCADWFFKNLTGVWDKEEGAVGMQLLGLPLFEPTLFAYLNEIS